MGQVTMDLSELDKIREDLKKANSTISDKDQMIKEKDEEIVKVKADKRTVKVINTQQPKAKSEFDFHMNMNAHTRSIDHMLESAAYSIIESVRKYLSGRHNGNMVPEVCHILQRNGLVVERNIQMETVTTTEYVNFDDIIRDINASLEQKLASEIDGYKKKISALNDTVTHAQINEDKAKKALIKGYEDQIKNLTETYDKDYKKLQDEFEAFRTNRDTRTFEEKIKDFEEKIRDLEAQLTEERARKWYQKRKKIIKN